MNYRKKLPTHRLMILLPVISLLSLTTCVKKTEPTLKGAFAEKFLIGAAVNGSHTRGFDTAAVALLDRQFNSITEENCLKWERVHPQPGRYAFDAADRYVDRRRS